MARFSVLESLTECSGSRITHIMMRSVNCLILARERYNTTWIRVQFPLLCFPHVSNFGGFLVFPEFNCPVQSLKSFVEIFYLVIANSQSIRRQLMASRWSWRFCLIIFTNNANLTQGHWLVTTSWANECTQRDVRQHKLFVFRILLGFFLCFLGNLWSWCLYAVDLVVIRIGMILVDPLLNHLLVFWCDIDILKCIR